MKKTLCIAGLLVFPVVVAWAQQQEQVVQITSADGFALTGYYFAAAQPGPGILLVHQCNRRGARTGYEDLAPRLAAAGMHVLLLDSRGFGKSRDEQYRDYHAQADLIDTKVPQDVEAAYQFLVSRRGVDQNNIGVVGASCGTWQAIPLARDHAEIRTLVFISGSYLGLDAVERAYETLLDRPILAVYSEDDRYGTPASMRAAFAQSLHPASKLIVYKGDIHGTPLFASDSDLEREIVAWFSTHLRTPSD